MLTVGTDEVGECLINAYNYLQTELRCLLVGSGAEM